MARGSRKTPLEKLQAELEKTQKLIGQNKENLQSLLEQEKEILDQIAQEELKELKNAIDKAGMTLEDVKALIFSQN